MRTVLFREHLDLRGMELITRHRDMFAMTSTDLDEFLVGHLDVLFEKR